MTAKSFLIAAGISIIAASVAAQTIPDPTDTILLTSAVYGATGELFISKANTNSVGLHCPVLLVEGFDLGNVMGWEVFYNLLNDQNLVDEMHAYGRDLLILNFGDSMIPVEENTDLTESAISYVNSNRADSTDKFTLVGVSLGGVTTRKALVDMPNHDVDTWLSFDAPHEGANIPLGIQEFLEFFGPYDTGANALLTILDQPAPRQLMLVHHTNTPVGGPAGGSNDTNYPARQDFVDAMNALGYPTNCKTIAISNGSGYGEKLPFDSGDSIIHWTHSGFFQPTIEADIYALPTNYTNLFDGYFDLIKSDSADVDSYYPYSLDNAPGGTRPTFYEVFTNIPPNQRNSGDDYCNTTNHCFVPTVSALGIPIDHIETNLATHAELLALSPFDEIHYAPTNEPHVNINSNNKRWVVRAVLEEYDTDGDGLDDYEEFLVGTDYNSADSKLTVGALIEMLLAGGKAVLSWDLFPNTQYEIWFSEMLDGPWSLIDTIPPSSDPDITREYVLDTEALTGYFKIVATPVDPVTD